MENQKTERSERLPLPVDQSVLERIRSADCPWKAASIVALHPCEEAVAIIDNLDRISAVYIIAMFRGLPDGETLGGDFCLKEYARSLVKRAQELRIRGTSGLSYAREEFFRENSVSAEV